MRSWLEEADCLAEDTEGIGTIELVLILIVLIGLVGVFKDRINAVIETLFDQIDSKITEE